MNERRFVNLAQKAFFNNLKGKDLRDFKEEVEKFKMENDYPTFITSQGKIINEKKFFEFLSWFLKREIKDINDLKKETFSKKENIKHYLNSKHKYFPTTKDLLIVRDRENITVFYKTFPKVDKKIVAVENMSSFFKLDFSLFSEYEYFVYLGGFSNYLTRQFLKDKEVLFFVDFDFYGLKIFNSFNTKEKEIFLPKNLEELLAKKGNQKLYEKQNCDIKCTTKNSQILYNLIKKHSKVLEQEILDVD